MRKYIVTVSFAIKGSKLESCTYTVCADNSREASFRAIDMCKTQFPLNDFSMIEDISCKGDEVK